jgi:hypothetical protein
MRLTLDGGARETDVLASDGFLEVDREVETRDLTSFSQSSERPGRKTASMEFPSKSITAAE